MKMNVLKITATRAGDDDGASYLAGHVTANSVTGSGDVRLLATMVVQLLPFTITLDAGTGTCDVDHLDVYAGHKLGSLPECTRDADRFDGWFATDGTRATADTIASERFATLTARYTEPTTIILDAGSGSCSTTSVVVYKGYAIEGLPAATGTGSTPDFFGWENGTAYVANGTIYDGTYTTLAAAYGTFATKIYAGTTYSSSYRKVGIYSATRISSAEPVVVSWGDGTLDYVNGNISKLTHEYANAGTYYTIGISDNISTLAVSAYDSTWHGTTTHNRYNIRRVLALSSRITSMPSYAFYYCQYMQITDACIGSGMTSIPNYCFYYCNYYSTMGTGSVEIPKKITAVGSYAFRYCYYLKNVTFEERNGSALTLNIYCFGGVGYYNASTIEIPSGVTSIPNYCFYYSRYLDVTLPASVTSIGTAAFYYCYYSKKLTIKCSTAPTIQSGSFGTGSNTMGYGYRTSGTNKLVVPTGATGYDTDNWTAYLLNASYGGFTKEEADL